MYPSLVGWIVIGIIAGWLTGKLMSGAGYGVLMDLILGLIGAVIGLDFRSARDCRLRILGQFGCRYSRSRPISRDCEAF
jgi:uncharacterized membrane protein